MSSPNVLGPQAGHSLLFVGDQLIDMNIKNSFFCLFIMLLFFSGCTAIENLDELNEMGQYSREKDAQHREVKLVDDHYDALTRIIDQGRISNYKDEAAFEHSFSDPILKKDLGDGTEQWLYRYAIYRLAKDKVYVDHHGRMIKWERVPCPSLF